MCYQYQDFWSGNERSKCPDLPFCDDDEDDVGGGGELRLSQADQRGQDVLQAVNIHYADFRPELI